MTAKNLNRIHKEGTYYHVYNKGTENKTIFPNEADYQVFLDYLEDYLNPAKSPESTKKDFTVNGRIFKGIPHQPKNYFNKVELVAYSLKPDHFHLLLHQITSKSLQAFIRSLCTRYSMYFNKKYKRTGTLFAGSYKSVIVSDETSLLLLTRYFHQEGGYSTYHEYLNLKETPWVKSKIVQSAKFKDGNYKNFVEIYEPSQKEKGLLEEIAIESTKQHLERRDLAEISSKPPLRIPELLVASTVFSLLLGIGIRNVNISQATSATLGTATYLASPAPTAQTEPKIMLTVKYPDAKVPINIRERPTVESKIIGEAFDDDKFEFVSEDSEWYQVRLPDGSTGFIFSTFINLPVDKQNLQSSTSSANLNPSTHDEMEASPSTQNPESPLLEIETGGTTN